MEEKRERRTDGEKDMETGIIEGVTEVIESKTEAICDRSALPDGTALEKRAVRNPHDAWERRLWNYL